MEYPYVMSLCQCRTPLNWIETGEKKIFGLDLIEEAEMTVNFIQDNRRGAKGWFFPILKLVLV
jgi:hypothetical protein